jgi:uncharacterized protein (DUF362 family)
VSSRCTRRELFAVLTGGFIAGAAKDVSGQARTHASNRIVSAKYKTPGALDSERLGALVDTALCRVTGASDASDAWLGLFSKEDHVSIKVNCLGGPQMATNPLLVMSVVDRLKRCGIGGRRIIIWDRTSRELEETGFELSRGGGGVQCYGTDEAGYGDTLHENGSVASLFSRILTERCNKVINMPILKDHGICGLTFALKNYFGAIHNPNKFHLNRCDPYIGDLNAMKHIRGRETLIVGDLTRIQADGGPSFKKQWAVPYGGVLVGTDPVAADEAALGLLERVRKSMGRPDLAARGLYPDYIRTAEARGAGSTKGMEHAQLAV